MSTSEAAPTLTAKGRQTRQAIEQAARKLFAERGFHGTTLADITSAAGKSPAVFYRYFADKEELFAGVVLVYNNREQWLHTDVPVRAAAAIGLVVLGWAIARDIGRVLTAYEGDFRTAVRLRATRPQAGRQGDRVPLGLALRQQWTSMVKLPLRRISGQL